MTHTPTPWKSFGTHILARIDHTDDVVLAKTFSNGTAAFIVRAVNAHDALVEQLERCKEYLHTKYPNEACIFADIEAALKLARGEV